ncbi:MAG: 16S rRNA (guanine(527)-N(7))-methyltransferase RsmG [Planctomycetota bacterium]
MPPPRGWTERVAALGIELEAGEIDRLDRYLSLLLAANERTNLTAVRDGDEAWDRHLLDALTLLPVLADAGDNLQREGGLRVLDLGTGGGLPGIPLAIVLPGSRFTLLDATRKKVDIVGEIAGELGLGNVEVIAGRAETLAAWDKRSPGVLRDAFDVVVARAVGRLAVLAELAVPCARVGGLCALVKGQKADEELAEAKKALHMLHAAHAGTLDTPTGRIVVLEKRRETPRMYPRRDGEPKNRPLGVTQDRA